MGITHSNSSYLADLSGRQDSLHQAEKQRGNVFQPTAGVCRGGSLAAARASLPGRQRVRQGSDSGVGTLAVGWWGPAPSLPWLLHAQEVFFFSSLQEAGGTEITLQPPWYGSARSRALVLSTGMFSKGLSHRRLSWLAFGIN